MERIPCTPEETCKYYPDCFEDIHHVYKQALADTALKAVFGNLPENKRPNCRAFHERDEAEHGWPDYPDIPEMKVTIKSAQQRGEISLSKRQLKRIGGL